MKIFTKLVAGKDQLFLEATTVDERNIIEEFTNQRDALRVVVSMDYGYKYPLLIIRKEAD